MYGGSVRMKLTLLSWSIGRALRQSALRIVFVRMVMVRFFLIEVVIWET
jgi:hypothetical protein